MLKLRELSPGGPTDKLNRIHCYVQYPVPKHNSYIAMLDYRGTDRYRMGIKEVYIMSSLAQLLENHYQNVNACRRDNQYMCHSAVL